MTQVQVVHQQSDLQVSEELISPLVNAVLEAEEQQFDEVCIYLVGTEEICRLHKHYFDDSTTTDCISFPMDDNREVGYRVLGDVFVCPRTAIDYAKQHDTEPYEETTLYIVHGILHLLGYDDIDEDDRKKMRSAESRNMANLKKLDLCLKQPVSA
ncbi:MAG: putative rRNA maturation factor [Chlamydiales bacterium]|jgi:probable rRNA maturation factor